MTTPARGKRVELSPLAPSQPGEDYPSGRLRPMSGGNPLSDTPDPETTALVKQEDGVFFF